MGKRSEKPTRTSEVEVEMDVDVEETKEERRARKEAKKEKDSSKEKSSKKRTRDASPSSSNSNSDSDVKTTAKKSKKQKKDKDKSSSKKSSKESSPEAASLQVQDKRVAALKGGDIASPVPSRHYPSPAPSRDTPSPAPDSSNKKKDKDSSASASASDAATAEGATEETPKELRLSSYRLSPSTVNSLKSRGINALFPIQAKTFDPIFDGKDLLGRARTGTGKTLAFSLPIVERLLRDNKENGNGKHKRGRKPRALVMAPTRELALQVSKEMEACAGDEIATVCVYGGTEYSTQSEDRERSEGSIIRLN